MRIAFAGFRHAHIFSLLEAAQKAENVTVTGCCEEDEAVREALAKERGMRFVYADYESLLRDETVEAVAIGDYFEKRGRMILAALRHGKHVICDKPLCTRLAELEEIEKLSAQNNLQVCCMLDLRYLPQTAAARAILESGELGDIRIASFSGQHCLDYENRPKWYFEDGKHGGTITDIAVHGIDLVRLLTGKNLTKIHCARVWNAFADKAPGFRDCGQFMVEMDGMALTGDVSYSAPKFAGVLPTYWSFCFWGTKGMLQFGMQDQKIRIFTQKETVIECLPASGGYFPDFITEINGGRTVLNTKEMLESQRQTLKIQRYADENADPDAADGDPGA